MTHKDIYTKFMIEYDKAGASTSYPSLTEYEVATVLDKAYNALIAQKVTGNNYRRSTFESDIKSIADLGPLVNTRTVVGENDRSIAPNVYKFDIKHYKDLVNKPYVFTHYLTTEETYGGMWNYVTNGITTGVPEIGWDEEGGRFVAVSGYNYSNTTTDTTVQNKISEMNNLIAEPQSFYVRRYNENGPWYYCHAPESGIVWELTESETGDTPQYEVRNTNLLYFLQGSMLYDGPKEIREETSNVAMPYIPHYYTATNISANRTENNGAVTYNGNNYNPIDGLLLGRGVPVKLVNHEMAQKFFTSASNIPWIKEPVCFIEGSNLFVVYDPLNPPTTSFRMTYIKQPNTFVKDLSEFQSGTWTYFTPDSDATDDQKALYDFECNSTVAEELVSLAIAFALENVESQRLNSKLNMRGLEA